MTPSAPDADARLVEEILAGEVVSRHGGSVVRRFRSGGEILYAKQHRDRSVREESANLTRLAEIGVRAARVIRIVESGDEPAWLVTEGVPEARPLADVFRDLPREERRSTTRRVSALVRALHDGGRSFPDLYARHVILDDRGEPWLIDVERLQAATPGRRARDLAALDLTAEIAGASRTDRVAFLRAYLDAERVGDRGRDLATRTARARRRLERKRRFHRHRLVVRREHRAALEEAGFRTFEDYRQGGPSVEVVRRLPDRENVRIRAGGTVYFGRRVPVHHLDVLRREWAALAAFDREGLPGPSPAVLGTDPVDGGYVFTARVPGRPLDDLLREGDIAPAEQRPLARDLGALVRRLHGLGFWHRDLYLCHVFADRSGEAWRLTLIDLARVGRRERPRSRWFVKDLAQLLHSLPRETVRSSVLGEFLRAYTGRRRLDRSARRLVRRVVRKAARIAQHVPRHS